MLRGLGLPPAEVAREVGVAYSTLRRHFRPELTNGRAAVIARIGARVVQRALAGNVAAAKFYLGRFAPDVWGQRDRHEVAGGDGETSAPPMLIVSFMPNAEDADGPGQVLPALTLHPGGQVDV